jgi:hypothetical protein
MSSVEHVVELLHERAYRDFASALASGDVTETTDRAAWMRSHGRALVVEFGLKMSALGLSNEEIYAAWDEMFTVLPDTMTDGERQYQIMQAELQRELTRLRNLSVKQGLIIQALRDLLKAESLTGATSDLHVTLQGLLALPLPDAVE